MLMTDMHKFVAYLLPIIAFLLFASQAVVTSNPSLRSDSLVAPTPPLRLNITTKPRFTQ